MTKIAVIPYFYNHLVTKNRMKPINYFGIRSNNQSPIQATQFNAYTGNMKLSMSKQSNKDKKNKSRFRKGDNIESFRLVKR